MRHGREQDPPLPTDLQSSQGHRPPSRPTNQPTDCTAPAHLPAGPTDRRLYVRRLRCLLLVALSLTKVRPVGSKTQRTVMQTLRMTTQLQTTIPVAAARRKTWCWVYLPGLWAVNKGHWPLCFSGSRAGLRSHGLQGPRKAQGRLLRR